MKSNKFPTLLDYFNGGDDKVYLIMEFVSGQTLYNVLKSKGQNKLTEEVCRKIFQQVV